MRSDRKQIHVCVFVVLVGLFTPALRAQQRPLRTPDATILPPGTLRIEAGLDFLQGVDFPLSGLSGDLTGVGVLRLRMAVGRRVEVQLEGIAQNVLQVNRQVPAPVRPQLTGGDSTHDVGDFSLWTKIRMVAENRHPALAFRFGFEMPNSNQARGIGTNTTNVYASLIAEKHLGRLDLFGQSGLGILQSPSAQFSQNDVWIYGGAFRLPVLKRLALAGEIAGRHSTRKLTPALFGTESRGQGRLGLVWTFGGFQWDAAAVAGIYRNDPTTGFTFGVSRDVRLFHWK